MEQAKLLAIALMIAFMGGFYNPQFYSPQLAYGEMHGGQKVVVVRVDGLSCPFCAYGLEKKLKNMEGVDKVEIRIDKGIAIVTMKEGQSVNLEKVKEAVKKAGFTPRKIEVREK